MLLFLVKFAHSLTIIYLAICLYVVWDYGLAGIYRRWLGVALASIVLEAVVFMASDFICPLTTWALALGDATGTDYLSEVLYLDRINYVENYAIFAAAGVGLAGWRYGKSYQQEKDIELRSKQKRQVRG